MANIFGLLASKKLNVYSPEGALVEYNPFFKDAFYWQAIDGMRLRCPNNWLLRGEYLTKFLSRPSNLAGYSDFLVQLLSVDVNPVTTEADFKSLESLDYSVEQYFHNWSMKHFPEGHTKFAKSWYTSIENSFAGFVGFPGYEAPASAQQWGDRIKQIDEWFPRKNISAQSNYL